MPGAGQAKLENKIDKTEKKLLELSISLKRIDREYQKLMEEMALSPQELKEYVENEENFSPPIWEQLQNEKKMLDEKLNLELNCVIDQDKTKKTITERGLIQKHWLFVR